MGLLFFAATSALAAVPFVCPSPAAVLAALTCGGAVTTATVRLAVAVAHVLSFAAFFGTTVWVSFIGGLIMFYALPRHAFGRAQSRLFPAYFKWSALEIATSLASLYLLSPGGGNAAADSASVWALRAALVLSLANEFLLEPATTATMFKRHVVENRINPEVGREVPTSIKPTDPKVRNDPEWKKLTRRFGALHGVSTLLNLACFGAALVHGFALAKAVEPALGSL